MRDRHRLGVTGRFRDAGFFFFCTGLQCLVEGRFHGRDRRFGGGGSETDRGVLAGEGLLGLGFRFGFRLRCRGRCRFRSGGRRTQVAVERVDLFLQIVVRHQRVDELVLFDGFDFFAEVQVGIGEQARGHDVAGIELEGFRKRLDGIVVLLLIAEDAAEADPGGKIGGVNGQTGAENPLGLVGLADFPKLLRQRVKKAALRVSLDLESKLFDFRVRRRLSHRGP